MSGHSGTRIAMAAIVATLSVVTLGIAGFALGRSARTSQALVQADERLALRHAYAVAYGQAFRTGRQQGRAQGRREGEAKGSAQGSHLGQLRAEAAAARAAARKARRRRAAAGQTGARG